jgi:hypothetical protein
MPGLSQEQLKIINQPFDGVEPLVLNGLFRLYERRWLLPNGVPVRARRQTVATMEIKYDRQGHVTETRVKEEQVNGFYLELAQKLGDLVLSDISGWMYDYNPFAKSADLSRQSTKYKNKADSNGEVGMNVDIFDFLDSDQEMGGPIIVKADKLMMPDVKTTEDFVQIMGTYQPEPVQN